MKYIQASAVISGDGLYRYELRRRWSHGGSTCLFLMLNPPTADWTQDDATIRRCVGFAARCGSTALVVANLFAYRARDPKVLLRALDPVGPENKDRILAAALESDLVIAGWWNGVRGVQIPTPPEILALVERPGMSVIWCLGRTRSGCPAHPLYLPLDAPLSVWAAK